MNGCDASTDWRDRQAHAGGLMASMDEDDKVGASRALRDLDLEPRVPDVPGAALGAARGRIDPLPFAEDEAAGEALGGTDGPPLPFPDAPAHVLEVRDHSLHGHAQAAREIGRRVRPLAKEVGDELARRAVGHGQVPKGVPGGGASSPGPGEGTVRAGLPPERPPARPAYRRALDAEGSRRDRRVSMLPFLVKSRAEDPLPRPGLPVILGSMSLTVNLPPEAEERLQREAAGMGLAVSELVRRLIESHLSRAPGDEATLALLAAWDKEDTTDDPRELEKRRLEWEEFKRAMNAGHSSHRTIYP